VSEKTEEPTAQRLDKAREDGDSGISAFGSQSIAFLVATLLLPGVAVAVADRSRDLLRRACQLAATRPSTPGFDPLLVAKDVLVLTLPFLGTVGLTAGVVSALQAGGVFATKKLVPDLSRLDPFAGFARLFSVDRLFTVARALLAGGFVALITILTLRNAARDLAHTSGRIGAAGVLAGHFAGVLLRYAAYVGLGIAAIDLVVTRRSWRKRLRMTKEEVKRERKESDGDPEVKAARERARHDVMTAVTLAKVREASVVVVNPTHLACALRYDEEGGDSAPVVVASGRGELAAQIVRAAEAYGVPVLRDVPLARALIELETGDAIPEALYEAVAEILRAAWEQK
jgi:flagellar biosynthesis protein FlhB